MVGTTADGGCVVVVVVDDSSTLSIAAAGLARTILLSTCERALLKEIGFYYKNRLRRK